MTALSLSPVWTVICLIFLPLVVLLVVMHKHKHKLFFSGNTKKKAAASSQQLPPELPGTYPILGSFLSFLAHTDDQFDWQTNLLRSSPTSTVMARHPLGAGVHIITANPCNVEHILKTKFSCYPKGASVAAFMDDLFGQGIFNVDGNEWKLQRKIASHEFSTKSLRKFTQTVVDDELNSRLLPILDGAVAAAAATSSGGQVHLDLQDLLRRFAFDNICQISFGYDPECLLPSLPESPFAYAFDSAVSIIEERFITFFPLIWRVKRFLNVGSERKLKEHIALVRNFAQSIAIAKQRTKKLGVVNNDSLTGTEETDSSDPDLLSRFINAGHNDEQFLTDIVISFIIAGRDTTSATLTWFFWLISRHPEVEQKILEEINKCSDIIITTNPNEMIYTQAALFESMRLYPPVPDDFKQAAEDDTWPDGTVVAAGTTVAYHIYAMGRMERIWGNDWPEFKPERWLEEKDGGNIGFVNKDPYSYPVFNAGPRICLGKEMGILQMKRIVAAVLKRYIVVPAVGESFEPVYVASFTAAMEGGFPVKIVKRGDTMMMMGGLASQREVS